MKLKMRGRSYECVRVCGVCVCVCERYVCIYIYAPTYLIVDIRELER